MSEKHQNSNGANDPKQTKKNGAFIKNFGTRNLLIFLVFIFFIAIELTDRHLNRTPSPPQEVQTLYPDKPPNPPIEKIENELENQFIVAKDKAVREYNIGNNAYEDESIELAIKYER